MEQSWSEFGTTGKSMFEALCAKIKRKHFDLHLVIQVFSLRLIESEEDQLLSVV